MKPAEDILRCPVCTQSMVRKKVRGIETDVCEQHGVWLDTGELETILKRQRRVQKLRQRRHSRDAYRRGITRGAVGGFWAYMFPD